MSMSRLSHHGEGEVDSLKFFIVFGLFYVYEEFKATAVVAGIKKQ